MRSALLLTFLGFIGCAAPANDVRNPPGTGGGGGGADASVEDAGTVVEVHACAQWSAATQVGVVNDQRLPEQSGLAASAVHPGIFWAENDSGNPLQAIAIRDDGSVAAVIPLTGATNTDVEDIAVAPCEVGSTVSCIYLADIGDNLAQRASVKIYRVPEPTTLTNAPLLVDVFEFTYPDGAHNAESFVVDRKTLQMYVLTKTNASLGDLYRIDGASPGTPGQAVKLRTVNAPGNRDATSTAASLDPTGTRILIRTYSHLWELVAPAAASVRDVWDAVPFEVPSAQETQAESVAYYPDDQGYLMGSEGVGEPLYRTSCR